MPEAALCSCADRRLQNSTRLGSPVSGSKCACRYSCSSRARLGQCDRQPGREFAAAATDMRIDDRRLLVAHGQDGLQMRLDLDRPYPEELGAQAFSGTRKLWRASSQRVTVRRFRLRGERHHHVIVEGHAADGQIPAALRGQVYPTAPRRVRVPQDDAGAAAAGHALHAGQDGIQHRLQTARAAAAAGRPRSGSADLRAGCARAARSG